MKESVTRGFGLLESFLAKQRAHLAERWLDESSRNGRLLDVGCGHFPYFLSTVRFHEKFGVERLSGRAPATLDGVTVVDFDVQTGKPLPFEAGSFDAVTLLAVFEHVEPSALPFLMADIRRVLKTGGRFILTTPAPAADRLLRLMARLRLVSPVEIEEHKGAYTPSDVRRILESGGFESGSVLTGHFEVGLNVWACATKTR